MTALASRARFRHPGTGMFIKRNRTRHGDKPYQSILLVQGKRVPAKRPPGRPAAGAPPPKTVVVHETLANLSRLPAELVALIEDFCQGTAPKAAAIPSARKAVPGATPVVFRVFDRVSYALIMSANRPVTVGDTVRTP